MISKLLMHLKRTGKSDLKERLDRALLSADAMLAKLREERLRAERSHSALGLVTIDFPGLVNALEDRGGPSPAAVSNALLDTLITSTRETDVRGWYEGDKIAILVPYTDQDGTQALVQKLTRVIASRLRPRDTSNDMLLSKRLKGFFRICALDTDKKPLDAIREHNLGRVEDSKSSDVRRPFRREAVAMAPQAFDCLQNQSGSAALAIHWPFSFELLDYMSSRQFNLKAKRMLDIVGALAGIVLFAPAMALIAVAIKLTSPGPVLFKQERMGLLGRSFTFLKFRSMKVGNDPSIHKEFVTKLIRGDIDNPNNQAEGSKVFKITDDPRVTQIGAFIRKTSLDELPQFFNVLLGDMSLVGPRPPISYECDEYRMWHCRRILEVKPGITGLWQTMGRSSTTFDEMVRLDLQYSRNWNVVMDVKILLKTVMAVFSGRGAY